MAPGEEEAEVALWIEVDRFLAEFSHSHHLTFRLERTTDCRYLACFTPAVNHPDSFDYELFTKVGFLRIETVRKAMEFTRAKLTEEVVPND